MSVLALASHAELSSLSEEYAKSLLAIKTANFEGFNMDSLPEYLKKHLELNQAVPLIVSDEFLAHYEKLSADVGALLLEVPRRYASKDIEFAARFYGFNNHEKAYNALVKFSSYDTDMYRLDLINSDDGFKVLEVNMGGAASGFYGSAWLELYSVLPYSKPFLEKHQKSLHTPDTVDIFFRHTLEQSASLAEVQKTKQINYGLKVPEGQGPQVEKYLADYIAHIAGEYGLVGTITSYPEHEKMEMRDGFVYLGDTRVDVYVKASGGVNEALYETFKLNNVLIYDGVSGFFSGDKRNMALATSERVDEYYTQEEREIFDKYVPWTAIITSEGLKYKDQTVDPVTLAIENKDLFVFKDADSHSGKNVFVGRFMEQEEWAQTINEYADCSNWILQKYAESKPYIFLDNELGFVDHEVVWGSFIIAQTAAGGTLRMKPCKTTDGVVNFSRNATESLFCSLKDIG